MEQILLGRSKSKKSVNEENSINVELSSNERVLPVDVISQTVDSYQQYLKEKDKSEVYRLIFTINPICTNILFNANTEIVYKEGSDSEMRVITTGGTPISELSGGVSTYNTYFGKDNNVLKRVDAIRDTAYSHPSIGNLVYHCGVDIFNNHVLRNKVFKVVNKIKGTETDVQKKNFNTIKDYLRDANGNIVSENIVKINNSNSVVNGKTDLHLYQADDVMSFKESVRRNLVEDESGWVGFINPCSMDIENYNSISLNKCLNDNKAGDFIDMYPDRSLYSFVPKYNDFRKRLEYNWDYLITYPYTSITDNELVSNGNINGIRCKFEDIDDLETSIFAEKNGETNFSVRLQTQLKNTFQPGTFVTFTFIAENGANFKSVPVKVEGVGKNGYDTQHFFSINFNGIVDCIMNWVNEDDSLWKQKINKLEIRVRRCEKGAECQYYIRKFKPLENIKRGGCKFSNSLNKLAFAENIYSDDIVQIVYNDDILTEGIKDNYNRQLSELYLTIVKSNRGHSKWYNQRVYNGDDIEFSHCFGEISSGLDMSPEWEKYNIHYLTAENRGTDALENDITFENVDFMGDIVEFSPNTFEETVLEDVYYRFNTAQRETVSPEYGDVIYDDFENDDYDIRGDFSVVEKKEAINNIAKEGYFYKAHYKVKLRTFEDKVKQGNDIRIRFTENTFGETAQHTYSGVTEIPYYLSIGDSLYFFNTDTKERVPAKVVNVWGNMGSRIEVEIDGQADIDNSIVFRNNPSKPKSAFETNDGLGTYYWRDIKPEKEIMYGDELFDSVFMNGAHYFHQNIMFYLKRQDPTGEYGLNVKYGLDYFTGASEGKIKDVSFAEYVPEGENDIC